MVFLGLSVLDLDPMYATDVRQTSDRSQKIRGGGIIKDNNFKHLTPSIRSVTGSQLQNLAQIYYVSVFI